MCIQHSEFRNILSNPDFNEYISHSTIDEAHCISQWDDDFRPAWSQLGVLRALIKSDTPIVALSATMGPGILQDVRNVLDISIDNSFHLNLGNNRPNIMQIVTRMRRGDDLERLNFLVDNIHCDSSGTMPRTLAFFESRDLVQKAHDHLTVLIPQSCQEEIAYIHAGLTPHALKHIMELFRTGKINILCATECVGMGSGIGDIDLVILFKIPGNNSILVQRIGRGWRAGQATHAIIFTECSVFETFKR
jgi:superfamily II DNA helicase RecQ